MDLKDVLPPTADTAEIAPCDISVDLEGNWSYRGNQITREDILELFYDNLQLTADGKYLIEWQNQRCLLEVADTPFVIAAVDRPHPDVPAEDKILLRLRHLTGVEQLDPAGLWVGADNVLYCRIRQNRWLARFSRPAYYQLAQWIEQDPQSGQFYLLTGGTRYSIGSSAPSATS